MTDTRMKVSAQCWCDGNLTDTQIVDTAGQYLRGVAAMHAHMDGRRLTGDGHLRIIRRGDADATTHMALIREAEHLARQDGWPYPIAVAVYWCRTDPTPPPNAN